MVRARRFSIRRTLGVAATGLLAAGTAAVVGAGPASAANPDIANFAISPSTPAVVVQGQSAVAVPSETFTLVNDFTANATITFTLAPNGATANCKTGTTDYVAFAATPTVNASGAPSGDTTPQIAVSVGPNTANDGACGNTLNDVLTLTFKNSASPSNTDTWTVTISGMVYNVGSTTTPGAVSLTDTTTLTNGTSSTTAASNATVEAPAKATASGNSPQVDVTVGTTGSASNLVITESAAGAVTGTICVTPISSETTFSFTGTPSTTASPTGTGAGTVSSTALSAGSILVTVSASSTTATTYTISGISVTDGPASGPAAAIVTTGGASCSADLSVISTSVPVFNSAPALNKAIAGADIDATAIAELEAAYPISGGCVPSHTVVLATDQNFPDALSASYLAGYLHTGLLLTPTAQLSNETQAALQAEGITNVYVVGGPLAVSQNTINQITATPAFTCGGPGVGTATGGNISVTGPIFGQTQYDTSEQIAATPPSSNVGTIDLAGAYANQYNDTTGNDSSAPEASGALRTAIVASGANFPDASSASVMAYHNQFPLVLTDPNSLSTQAATTLSALGIQQVIVLGGPLAVSDADVSSIMGMGISVIRVAGQDATDTAVQLASFELNQQGTTFSGLGWGATGTWHNTVLVARGDFYSDALAGSVLAKINASPLLLTENPSTLGTYLPGFLNAGGSAGGIDGLNAVAGSSGNIQTVQPLGGPLALNASTLSAIAAAVASG